MVSLMIHLGDRLGLYRAMDGAGPLTPAELAQRAGGLAERWVLEWLRGQAAAKLVDYRGDDRFELTPIGAAVLADESGSLAFAAGAFGGGFAPEMVDELADAFRTGIGLTYDMQGPNAAHRTERMLGPWARLALVPTILPALDGVVAKLERGAHVLDVGCGAGVAIFAMAKAFPKSVFDGYDLSHHAIARARETAAHTGFTNVEFFERRGEEVPPDPVYDFVLTFDCLHDMTRPDRVTRAIRARHEGRRHLADQGHQVPRRVREEHAQPDAGDDVRLLGLVLHVVGAVGAGRHGPRHRRAQPRPAARDDGRGRVHAVPPARLRGSGEPLLRGAAVGLVSPTRGVSESGGSPHVYRLGKIAVSDLAQRADVR